MHNIPCWNPVSEVETRNSYSLNHQPENKNSTLAALLISIHSTLSKKLEIECGNSLTGFQLLTPNLLPKFKFWAKVTLKWSLWHLFDFIFDRKTVWPENIKISIRKYIFFVSKFFHHDSLRIWSPDLFFVSNPSGNA